MKAARAPLAQKKHHFEWDGQPADHNGELRCRHCGTFQKNRHHQNVPRPPPDDRQLRLDIDG